MGRLIPAGTGGAAREIRTIASDRDIKIIEQKKLEEQAINIPISEELVEDAPKLD